LVDHVLSVMILVSAGQGIAAERFYISIVGPTLSYVPLFYAQEKGFFAQEGFDLQVLIVRGVIGVSSLMSGEIDVTCHAGSGFSAALRGVPIKIISVTRDRPVHELIVAPNINSPADLKGKAIAVGSLDGTAAVMTRRILQAKGLDAQEGCEPPKHGHAGALAIVVLRQSRWRNDDAAVGLSSAGPRLQSLWPRAGLHALSSNRRGNNGREYKAETGKARALS
jgi:hypothetical protein